MNALTRSFNKRCSSEYRFVGFLKAKGAFVRLSNDVLHVFSLKNFRNEPLCTVEFGIIPLCGNIPIYLEAGKYELSGFEAEWHRDWRYDPKSNDSIELCVDTLIRAMNDKLIPLYTMCEDCKSTLPVLMKLEESFDINRIKWLELIGECDRASPLHERSMFDSNKFYMALKSCDYDYAEKYLRFHISYCQNELELMERPESTKQPEIVKIRITENLNVWTDYLKRLTSGDYAFFDNLLLQNEAQTKSWLLDRYPAVSKLFKNA